MASDAIGVSRANMRTGAVVIGPRAGGADAEIVLGIAENRCGRNDGAAQTQRRQQYSDNHKPRRGLARGHPGLPVHLPSPWMWMCPPRLTLARSCAIEWCPPSGGLNCL